MSGASAVLSHCDGEEAFFLGNLVEPHNVPNLVCDQVVKHAFLAAGEMDLIGALRLQGSNQHCPSLAGNALDPLEDRLLSREASSELKSSPSVGS